MTETSEERKKRLLQKLDEKSKAEGWYQSSRYWEEWDEITFHDFYVECAKKGIKLPPNPRR